jgi:myo-inositol-hexaphosphate 3-phosphohydrolase
VWVRIPPPASSKTSPTIEARLRVGTVLFVALLLSLAAISIPGCSSSQERGETQAQPPPPPPPPERWDFPSTVRPFAETPNLTIGSGDDADDVAIHPSGYVVGTNKNDEGGLEVYDRTGRRLQWLQLGETNNVDLRGNTVVSSNRTRDGIDVLSLERGMLTLVRSFPVAFEPYGLCLYRKTVIVTANGVGRVEQYSLTGKPLRKLSAIETQSEGCVTDDARSVLYIAEEEKGIWRFAADPEASPRGTLIDTVGENLAADVEGLTFVNGHLIASSQGDSSFAVYRDDTFVATFRIAGGGNIDGAAGTDGIDANAALNLLVVHDAENEGGESSNYKYVRLSELFRR